MRLYDNCNISIRVAFFGFVLVAFGFLIQNESVNIFYTFKNSFLLILGEGCLKLGTTIVANLPLIFMLNLVCKRANSGYPVVLAIVGYFAYLIATMIFAPTTLGATAYNTGSGINSIFNVSTSTRYPLETGLVGSLIVAMITRISYIRCRHRSNYSILGFLKKDSAGIIYNIIFCSLAGIVVAYVWPIIFNYLQAAITYISKDLMDPMRLAIYGVLDRVLSIIGLNNLIRQPFWYTALGGSYQTIAGQSIIGDVNIWKYVKDSVSTFIGAGRFITPYYVINLFMIPAIFLGILSSITDKQERSKILIPCFAAIALSIVCGNPLPLELVLLFTSPLLLILYLLSVGGVYYYLTLKRVFLGSNIILNSVVTAMPGNLPDFLINIRNLNYSEILKQIALTGLVAGLVLFILTRIYYTCLAYDVGRTGKIEAIRDGVILASGGKENILSAGSGLFKLCVHLNDLEAVDYSALKSFNLTKIVETKDGFDIEFGSSSWLIADAIKKELKSTKK